MTLKNWILSRKLYKKFFIKHRSEPTQNFDTRPRSMYEAVYGRTTSYSDLNRIIIDINRNSRVILSDINRNLETQREQEIRRLITSYHENLEWTDDCYISEKRIGKQIISEWDPYGEEIWYDNENN